MIKHHLVGPAGLLTLITAALAATASSQPVKNHYIAGGYVHSLAVKTNGQVWAWGNNDSGQLGIGLTPNESFTPVQAGAFTNAVSVAAGYYHSMALTADGKVYAWGYNDDGVLGDSTNTDSYVPLQVPGLTTAVSIGAGQLHSLAVLANGDLYAWGNNIAGQLGDGTTTSRNAPYHVSAISNVVAADGGSNHTVALKSNGEVWCWGYNGYGNLGDGTTTDSLIPVKASATGLGAAKAISAGNSHSLLLTTTGEVWAWGGGASGELGNGGTSNSSVPVKITTLSNVVSIDASDNFSLAVTSDGKVWGWGLNYAGQVDASGVDILSPVQISGLSTNGATVAAGAYHSLELQQGGGIEAWGFGIYGQLGDGLATSSATPVVVSGGGGYGSSVPAPSVLWAADNVNPTTKGLFASYNFTPVVVGGSLSQSRVNDISGNTRHATARNLSKVVSNVLTDSTNGISQYGFGSDNAYHFAIDAKTPVIDYRNAKSLSFWFRVDDVSTSAVLPIFSYVPYGAIRTAGSTTGNQHVIRALMQENATGVVEVFFRSWESEIYSIRERWSLDRSAAQLENRWVNLTFVWKGGSTGWYAYLDGRLQTRTIGTLRHFLYNSTGNDTFAVGAQAVSGSGVNVGFANSFDGTFDRVRLFTGELSGADVLAIRQQDTDGDGLWDATESPLGAARGYTWDNPSTDTDGDGVSDLLEQAAETDPGAP